MAMLSNICHALDLLAKTLNDDLTAIHDTLLNMQNMPHPQRPTREEIDALAARVVALRDNVSNITP